MILASAYVEISEHFYYIKFPMHSMSCQGVLINIATLIRLGPGQRFTDNKYLLWFSMALLLREIRPSFEKGDSVVERDIIVYGLTAAVFALWIWKGFLAQDSRPGANPPTPKKMLVPH